MENYNTEKENNDVENRENKMYESLKVFFKRDMRLKENMSRLAPTEMDDYNEETRMEYIDKLYGFLREAEDEFCIIAQNFSFSLEASEAIKNYFNKSKEAFLIDSYEKGVGQNEYREQISSMNEKLVEEVKEKLVGYTLNSSEALPELINKSKSINELLHVIHSYIINNDKILQAMPIIAIKENDISGDPIILYGEQTELAQKLFNEFPSELDCGNTDIISMQNKILMMIRDRGHALTIDIDNTNEKDILVKYFVPKLCNLEMIKKLPGVDKISPNGAVGMFMSNKGELSKKIFDFIEKVPTDASNILNILPRENIEYDKQTEEEYKQKEGTYLFGNEDVKEMAMETSENGVRTERLVKLQEKIKKAIRKIKSKVFNGKEVGGNNDRTTRN